METHGPLGTLWAGSGLIAFYIGLVWINALLGLFLTPLFIIPITWFLGGRRQRLARDAADADARSERDAPGR